MANRVQIHIDTSQIHEKLEVLKNISGGAQKATMRAMNRCVSGMKTDAKKEIATGYTVKQKDVADKLILKKATTSDLSIIMRSKGRPMRLARFSIKKNKKPGVKGGATVHAKVKKGGSGGLTGGFIATMVSTNGITGVFRRTGRFKKVGKGAYRGQTREMIEQLYGPGVVQMLDEPQIRTNIQEKATERFMKEFDHQVDHLLNQQKG